MKKTLLDWVVNPDLSGIASLANDAAKQTGSTTQQTHSSSHNLDDSAGAKGKADVVAVDASGAPCALCILFLGSG